MERTVILLKPDAVKRRLVGEIVGRIERKGFKISHMKMAKLDKAVVEEHYAHCKGKSFFNDMVGYMTSGEVVAMIVEGEDVITMMRMMIGKTLVTEAAPGTIRGDFGFNSYENLIHGSDAVESAEIEVARFFPEVK
ncbi:MAG: nucleoside-diphosphate kinase [Deltaproteobacteria bacterium]